MDSDHSLGIDPNKVHLNHGYAMSSHSSQGQTADRGPDSCRESDSAVLAGIGSGFGPSGDKAEVKGMITSGPEKR